MTRFWLFSKDLILNGIGLWLVPWIGLTFVAYQLYAQFKANTGMNDLGLLWPAIVLALMLTFGHVIFGPRFKAIYDKHFPEG